MSSTNEGEPTDLRPARYISHALVEVKKFRNLPFFVHSAILLDMSVAGFKIEFTGQTRFEPGAQMWIQIPLYPLGIKGPKYLSCRVEVKWFDDTRMRMGGVFVNIEKASKSLVDQVISRLRDGGQRI